MEHHCPICNCSLVKPSQRKDVFYNDYKCVNNFGKYDHFYVHRIIDNDILKIKLRIDNLYLKINFDENFSQVWTVNTKREDRIKIQYVWEIDFSDLEKVKRKIKTLLTFS